VAVIEPVLLTPTANSRRQERLRSALRQWQAAATMEGRIACGAAPLAEAEQWRHERAVDRGPQKRSLFRPAWTLRDPGTPRTRRRTAAEIASDPRKIWALTQHN